MLSQRPSAYEIVIGVGAVMWKVEVLAESRPLSPLQDIVGAG